MTFDQRSPGRGERASGTPDRDSSISAPGKRTLVDQLPASSAPGRAAAITGPATVDGGPGPEPGGADPQVAAAKARLARPAYAYLQSFAGPVIAQLESPGLAAVERPRALSRLERLFAVSHTPDGGGETAAKAASNAHHQAIGDRIETRLAAVPQDGQTPEDALAGSRAAAPRLAAEVAPELEDGVHATVDVLGLDENQIEAEIAIAPNDFRSRAKIAGAALGLAGAGALWLWRSRRNARAAQQQVALQQAAQPAPIRGGVNHNQDCFMLAVLQMVASAYAGQIDPTPDAGNPDRESLRQAVLAVLPDLNSGGAALDADRVSLLRSLMVLNRVVDSLDGQWDAGETFRRLMTLLRPQVAVGARTANSVVRHERRQIDDSLPANEFNQAPPDNPLDYGENGRRERDSVEDGIYVPVTGGTGLIDYLSRICGGGVVDHFDPRQTQRHEWAQLDGEAVSITAVRVSQHFTQLPDVLPVTVQRWRNNLTRDPREFVMPEVFALPVHGGRWPVIKTYRLQAVVYHSGQSMHGGHYWAHRRVGDRWLRADDASITADRQAAQPGAPVERELPHDINHGYLYTYVLQSQREAWYGGSPTGTNLDTARLPAALPAPQAPAQQPRAPESNKPVRTVDSGGKRTAVRGGPARSAPAPDFDKACALLPRSDQFDFGDKLAALVEMALPRVLQAYTVDVAKPKLMPEQQKTTSREVSLMHAGAATALIENLVIWWMVLHPSETKQGFERIDGYLWHHINDTVKQLESERGQRDIGAREEDDESADEPATQPATKPVTDSSTKPATDSSTKPATDSSTKPATDASNPSGQSTKPSDKPTTEPAKPKKVKFSLWGNDEDEDDEEASEEEPEVTVDSKGIPLWLRHKQKIKPRDKTITDQAQSVELFDGPAFPLLCTALDAHHGDAHVKTLLQGYFVEETVANVPLVQLLERALGGENVQADLAARLAKVSALNLGQITAALGPLGIVFDASALGQRSARDRSAKSDEERAVPLWLWTSTATGHPELVKQLVARGKDAAVIGLMHGPLQKPSPGTEVANAVCAAMAGTKTGSELFHLLAPLLRKHGIRSTGRAHLVAALALLAPSHGLNPEEQKTLSEEPPEEELQVDAVLEQAARDGWITKYESERVGAMIGRRALAGILSRAMKGGAADSNLSSKLPGTRAVVEAIDGGKPKTELGPPLTARSLMVDTNLVDVLLKDRDKLDAGEREVRDQVEAMMREHNIADLRLTNMNRGETFQRGELIGTVFLLPEGSASRAIPWYGVLLAPDVDHRGGYADVFDQLEERSVGENKGHADRSMIADAFCADTEVRGAGKTRQRVVPHFATADEGILKPLSGFAKGKDGKALDHRRTGDAADFFQYLERSTGARRFRAEIEGRALNVHAIRKPKPPKPDAPAKADASAKPDAAPPKPPAKVPASDGPFDQFVLGDRTVADLVKLIAKHGYEAVISGGAVRDVIRKRAPNDIDLKANIPHALLDKVLRAEWGATSIAIVPDMRLLQIGEIDVMCGEPATRPGKLDRGEAAAKADFRMNALQLALGEKPSDPLAARDDGIDGVADAASARLTFVADPGAKATGPDAKAKLAERQAAVIKYLQKEPWVLGRTLKFLGRGYTLAPEMLDAIRNHAVEILGAMRLHERPLEEKSLLLHKCEVSSPEELVVLLRRFHFTPEAIRLVIPDSVAGRHGDGGESFERSVMPRNRGVDTVEDTWDPRRPPQLKVDVETGRIYQYRVCAVLPPKGGKPRGNAEVAPEDKVILDVDCSNHDISGHPSPHYHVYRWLGGKWDKKQSGLSSTGQPGTPPMDGGVYLGPTPWRWTEALPDQNMAEALVEKLRGQVAVAIVSDVVTLGKQVRLHRHRLDEIHAAGQLAKLLLLVHNLDAGLPFDPDEQIAKDLTGSHKGQQRIRLTGQVDPVVAPFLASCGVDTHERFAHLDDAGKHRLHDLAAGNPRADLRKPAATWALKTAGTVGDFVQRFEFFLAAAGPTGVPPDEAIEAAAKESLQAVDAAKLVAAVQIDPRGDVPALVQAAAPRLGFASAEAAAYHARKHPRGGASAQDSAALYLAAARETVAKRDEVVRSTELDGGTSLVFWRGDDKAVVRVALDGTTHLLTFFTKGK